MNGNFIQLSTRKSITLFPKGFQPFYRLKLRLSLCVILFILQLNRAGGVLKTNHGILLKSLNQSDAGLYHCLATENNFKHTMARVALRILDRDIVLALTARDEDEEPKPRQAAPYAQLPTASAAFPPEIRLINQYCQSYWDQLSPKPQQQRKRTSRRHTESQDQGLG